MKQGTYEFLIHADPELPVIFHHDIRNKGMKDFIPHWHESIELLFFREGKAAVWIDGSVYSVRPGDLAIVNSGCVHSVMAEDSLVQYDCLIVDLSFCRDAGIPPGSLFRPLVRSAAVERKYNDVVEEYEGRALYYQGAVKANIYQLFITLAREQETDAPVLPDISPRKVELAKGAIRFIQEEFPGALSLSTVAQRVGFNRSYLCRTFREVTGYSLTDFINLTRCVNARKLLLSGCPAGEAARRSGFENLSYFSRVYKKHMGCLPSDEK